MNQLSFWVNKADFIDDYEILGEEQMMLGKY